MKVLFAASECTPFVKTGGLADVIGTLPNALSRAGADVRVILPKYRDIPREWKDKMSHLLYFYVNLGWRKQYCGIDVLELNGVTYYFVDNEFYFARDSVYGSGNEEGERFGYFCRAVLEALQHIGFKPDVLHCNDWQTGMIPLLLSTQYDTKSFYKGIKTVFTIHNLRFQGIFPWMYIDDLLGIGEKYFTPDYLEYYGGISFMKGGIVFSDSITTVSPTYALEIQNAYYGERMEGLIRARKHKLLGILNGIDPDEYDPRTDRFIPEHFSSRSLAGKAVCKREMQEELGLEVRADVPLIAMITRLTDQKGLDLVECVLDDIMRNDVQLAVLGKGDERYGELLSWAAWRYQGRMAARIELNEALAHRLYAAADIFLMPSQFEPCGLSQMISMRYGTVPIVRETGGLHDSVMPYNKYEDAGNGFSFANYNAHEMLFTIERTLEYFRDKPLWDRLMRRAMKTNFSWDNSARQYLDLYTALIKMTALVAEPAESPTMAAEPIKPTEESRAPAAKVVNECVIETPKDMMEALPASPEASPEDIERVLEHFEEGNPVIPDPMSAEKLNQPCLEQNFEVLTEKILTGKFSPEKPSKKKTKKAEEPMAESAEPKKSAKKAEKTVAQAVAEPVKRGRKPKEKAAEVPAQPTPESKKSRKKAEKTES